MGIPNSAVKSCGQGSDPGTRISNFCLTDRDFFLLAMPTVKKSTTEETRERTVG